MATAVFAMQGLGQLASALMALIVVAAYKSELETVPDVASCSGDCISAVDKMWRIIIAFGGVPGWFALYYRLTIPETPRYTFDVLYDVEKASMDTRRYRYGKAGNTVNPIEQAQVRRDMAKYKTPRPTVVEIFRYYSKKSNFIKLFGTAFSWFFLDLAFYGLSFSSASLLSTMGFDKRGSLFENLKNTATGQIVLICAGAIPGYWMTVFTVDRLGRKPIQIGGFAILTIIFCVLGFAWKGLTKIHLLVLYVLAQFFFNFGPNATTFITPAEIFPTRVRSTGHGISAGLGKLGAVIAQVFFAPMIKRGATHDNPTPWIHGVMQIFALFMFLGCLTSLLVPESKSARLEDLAGEGEDIYELQFRSQFYTGGERSPLGSAPSGRGSAVSGGGEYARGRGRGRGAELDEDPEKGKWWKLG
ncbi:hypothetical protein SLS60_001275 [Paraconiothyrium brasiliense]|uniref:Major facilitator superfamily (MFS) profile domain-containing protein n=1 Tax=Paraconiothyrium brasiliense TaxID=300254 RepID=A0ABR3S8N0_9PLEO